MAGNSGRWANARQRLLAAAGLAAIVGAVVGGLAVAGLLGNRAGGEGIRDVTLLAPANTAGGELSIGPERGQLAPGFEVSGLDGSRHRLSDFRGKAVVLNFWATWCLFCQFEMPDLHQLKLSHEGDLVIFSVNRRERAGDARNFLENVTRKDGGTGVSFDVNAIDPDDTLYREYRALGMPATFFIDPGGVVRHVANGPIRIEQMEQALLDTLPDDRTTRLDKEIDR